MGHKFLLRDEVEEVTGLSKSTIRRLERAGNFPKRRLLSQRRVGWVEVEVMDWISTRNIVV